MRVDVPACCSLLPWRCKHKPANHHHLFQSPSLFIHIRLWWDSVLFSHTHPHTPASFSLSLQMSRSCIQKMDDVRSWPATSGISTSDAHTNTHARTHLSMYIYSYLISNRIICIKNDISLKGTDENLMAKSSLSFCGGFFYICHQVIVCTLFPFPVCSLCRSGDIIVSVIYWQHSILTGTKEKTRKTSPKTPIGPRFSSVSCSLLVGFDLTQQWRLTWLTLATIQ